MNYIYFKNLVFAAVIIMTFISNNSYGQTKFVNEFLNIGVGARAHGMFGAVTATESDATAAYWNAAGLTDLKAPFQLSAMHANWFGGIANYDYVSIAKRFNSEKKSVGAITIIRMAIDNIPNTLQLIGPDGSVDYDRVTEFSTADYGFLFSYARGLNDSGNLSLGGSAKIIHRSIGEFGTAWGFGADLGLKWRKGNFDFAVSARDITTTFNAWSFNLSEEDKIVFEKTGNEIPVSSTEISLPRFVFGAAYHDTIKSFSYLVELDANISTNGTEAQLIGGKSFSVDPSFGLELGYAGRVFLRGGLGNIQKVLNNVNASEATFEVQPNVGLGLVLGRLKVDYALANVGSVSGVLSSHIFSLTLDFAERKR